MNKIFFSILLICSFQSFAQKVISFPEAKFHTGDSPEWKDAAFDDSKWATLKTNTLWEDQGFARYDGYAWYRITFNLPDALKQNAVWKDSLSFWLGTIDDVDETFLNGIQIGETGTFPTDTSVCRTKYDTYRKYNVPLAGNKLRWNGENVIAIRVFDKGGGGGMFGGLPFVKMMAPVDELKITVEEDSSTKSRYNGSVQNISAKIIKGKWMIQVKDGAANKIVKSVSRLIEIPPFTTIADKVDVASNKRFEIIASFNEVHSGIKSASKVTPYILTPAAPDMPRITSARVFGVRPNAPLLFKISATGKKPLQYTALQLPGGLSINRETGIITGNIAARGNYTVNIIVSNQLGSVVQNFEIKVGDQLALTPPMGWNSWNCWGLTVDDEKVKSSAQAFIDKGLIDHGWGYINIDDGWQDPQRAGNGEILPNKKFGDIEGLATWLHDKGLKFGIYSSPGTLTCGGYTGSYQHELQDAATYNKWGVDYLKYDWCSFEDIFSKEKDTSLQAFQKPYQVMELALKAQPRDMVYSLCQYGMAEVWKWGKDVNGNSWRTTGDIRDNWGSVVANGFDHPELFPYAKPGNWNDPDMLVVGKLGWSGTLHNTFLTPDEQYAHISLWCLLSSPLLLGCDVSKLDDFTLNLITNDEVLALDQDPAGRQARQRIKTSDRQIWVKELADGTRAVGIFNMSDAYMNINVNFEDIGLPGKFKVRDLWRQADVSQSANRYASNIPPHGVALIKLVKN